MTMAGAFIGAFFFLSLSLLRKLMYGGGFGSYPGWAMFILSLAQIPMMFIAVKRLSRARTAYALLAIGGSVGYLGFLDAGLRFFMEWAGLIPSLWVGLLMILGVGAVPALALCDARRKRSQMESQTKRWIKLLRDGLWDPSVDVVRLREFNRSPPLVAQLLLMVAPALGVNFRRFFGQDSALAFLALFGALFPYWFLHLTLSAAFSRIILISQVERQLGRPVVLAEKASGRRHPG